MEFGIKYETFNVGDLVYSTVRPFNPPFEVKDILWGERGKVKQFLIGDRREDNQNYFKDSAHVNEATKLLEVIEEIRKRIIERGGEPSGDYYPEFWK